MTDEPYPSRERWLRFKSACKYLDIAPATLALKLNNGSGPPYHVLPGSRNKLFKTTDLDAWILSAPKLLMTPAERERLAKLQAGAERARQERRARRQAKIGETVTA